MVTFYIYDRRHAYGQTHEQSHEVNKQHDSVFIQCLQGGV